MRAWTNWTITACCVSFLMFYACQSSYDSISSKDKLPATSEANAAGYDDENDIILIFGGASNDKQQFIQFDVQTSQFSLDPLYTPQEIRGWGQNYFQLNNTLWMLNRAGTQFVTANTHPPYDVTVPNITIPTLVDDDGCLAMTDHHIFVVGGATAVSCGVHASVQIYDMIDDTWLSGVPSLPNNRMRMACYAVDDTLYAIGGVRAENQKYDSIFTLNISDVVLTDISSQQWQVSLSALNTPSDAICIVKHRNDLIAIGGENINYNPLNDVYVIHTLTGECFLAGTLSTAAGASTCILHSRSNTLYIFGGKNARDSWQFIDLPTVDPTTNPTSLPTQFPTSNPQFPTSNPTVPTSLPTQFSTYNPSKSTLNQTQNPSFVTLQPLSDTSHITYSTTTSTVITTQSTDSTDSANRDAVFVMDHGLMIMLIVVVGSLCFITVIVVGIICGILKKKRMDSNHNKNAENTICEDTTPGITNEIITDHSDDGVVVMAYTNEGVRGSKDGGVMPYTNEGPQSITLEKKIWNNEIQLVDMEYHTRKPNVLDKKAHSNMLELQTWLQNEVGLSQYLEVLVSNGYESMQIVKDISNSTELKDIGIESKQHQMVIMEEIHKWKNKHAKDAQDQDGGLDMSTMKASKTMV
eukprot:864883_1